MKLENLNLVELNAQEVQETEGGIFGLDDAVLLVAGALLGAALTQDIDRLRAAYNHGYNAAGGRH